MASNPDNKRRSDGRLFGGKAAQRQGKVHRVTGRAGSRNMEVGNGTKDLSARRILGWLFGGDDDSGK